MGSFQITCLDLECGGGQNFSAMGDDDEESTCISEAGEGSCHTQFYSTAGDSTDGYNLVSEIDEIFYSRRVSSVVGSDCSVDVENGIHEFNIFLELMERDCRICHSSFQVEGSDVESGIAIELGCSCKNDLAVAHQHCAETWFGIKGNRICEICKSIARNVVIPNDIESTQQIPEVIVISTNANSDIELRQQIPEVIVISTNANSDIELTQQIPEVISTNANSVPVPSSTSETLVFLISHRLVNILLPCIVCVFFLSWLFHFHMPF